MKTQSLIVKQQLTRLKQVKRAQKRMARLKRSKTGFLPKTKGAFGLNPLKWLNKQNESEVTNG